LTLSAKEKDEKAQSKISFIANFALWSTENEAVNKIDNYTVLAI